MAGGGVSFASVTDVPAHGKYGLEVALEAVFVSSIDSPQRS